MTGRKTQRKRYEKELIFAAQGKLWGEKRDFVYTFNSIITDRLRYYCWQILNFYIF